MQLNGLYAQQAQIKYLFYGDTIKSIPIEQAPRLALVLEREQRSKELELAQEQVHKQASSNSIDDTSNLSYVISTSDDNVRVIQDQRINSFEDIYGSKKPIELSKIFEKQDEEDIVSNRVFVRGRAGVGKTTLCQFIANECSQGRLWKDKHDGVFWIPLRNLTKKYYRDKQEKGEKITLAEVVYQECFQNSVTVTLEDVKRFLASLPRKLWLCDGYDEIAALDKEDTPIGTLLKTLLSSEHVILTSRPYAIPENLRGYKQLENIGFLNEDIEDYVQKFFTAIGRPDRVKDFLIFIKQNPLLWGSAHIPIILELISSVWNTRRNQGGELNEQLSMTELYEELVLKLCKRYLQKRSQNPIEKEKVRRLRRQVVFKECKDVLGFLGELAFEASKRYETSILIKKDLVQELLDKYDSDDSTLFQDILDAGLLKNTGDARDAIDQEYYFIHLTFQGYFIAYHIVQKLKQNNPSIIQFIKENKYTQSLEVTWWFVAGLLKNELETLEKFFDALEEEPRDLIGFCHQMLLMRCMDECNLQVKEERRRQFFNNIMEFFECENKLSFYNIEQRIMRTVADYLALSLNLLNHPITIDLFTRCKLSDLIIQLSRKVVLPISVRRHHFGMPNRAIYGAAKFDSVFDFVSDSVKPLVRLTNGGLEIKSIPEQNFEYLERLQAASDYAEAAILRIQSELSGFTEERLTILLEDKDFYTQVAAERILIKRTKLPEVIIERLVSESHRSNSQRILALQSLQHILELINCSAKKTINAALLTVLIMKCLVDKIPIYCDTRTKKIFIGTKNKAIVFDGEEDRLSCINSLKKIFLDKAKNDVVITPSFLVVSATPASTSSIGDDDQKQTSSSSTYSK